MRKKALITGITGQDGAYLTQLLLEKGYEVHGLKRRVSLSNTARIEGFPAILHDGDLTDTSSLLRIMSQIEPDEVYNLGAQSHVALSFEMPEYTADVDGVGALRLLEAIRHLKLQTKFYQASTSELFGKVQEVPQREATPFYPRSPYACAKLFAYWSTVNYREAYGLFACNGILFNHESPLRGEEFVTRKITKGLSRIILGLQECLFMGNLEAKRDWGHAKDYVEMQWLMLQQEIAEDYIIATGYHTTVRAFIEKAAAVLDMEIIWEGEGISEVGRLKSSGKIIVAVDPKFFRPAEVDTLLGDASKAHKKLGWKPKISLDALVEEMVQSDLKWVEAYASSDRS